MKTYADPFSNGRVKIKSFTLILDQLSANAIQAQDAIDEVSTMFGKRIFYISGGGDFLYSPVQEPHEFLLRALTNGLN